MPFSEGIGGLRPNRLAERAREMDEPEFRAFVIRLVMNLIEILAVALLSLVVGVTVLLFLIYSIVSTRDARRVDVDHRFAELTCLAIHDTPPGSAVRKDFQDFLDRMHQSCAPGRATKPSPTRTVTRTRTRTTYHGAPAPAAPTTSATPSADAVPTPGIPRVTRTVALPGPTVRVSPPQRTTHPTPPRTPPPTPIIRIDLPPVICDTLGLLPRIVSC